YYPAGAAKKTGVHFGGPIMPNPDYRLYADIYGGYGVRVKDPKDIQQAIDRALRHNAAGRLARIAVVLNDYLPRQWALRSSEITETPRHHLFVRHRPGQVTDRLSEPSEPGNGLLVNNWIVER